MQTCEAQTCHAKEWGEIMAGSVEATQTGG